MRRIILAAGLLALAAPAMAQDYVWIIPPPAEPTTQTWQRFEPGTQPAPQPPHPCRIVGQYIYCQ